MPTITLIDEIFSAVEGIRTDDLHELIENTAIPDKNAYMTAAVKTGNWDGKVRMVSESGIFYQSMIDEVIDCLVSLGYDVDNFDINDERKPAAHASTQLIRPSEKMFPDLGNDLWEHQTEFFEIITDKGIEKGIFDASTSAGKTIVIGGTAKVFDHAYRSLTVTIKSKLVDDSAKIFDKLGLDYVKITSKVPPKKRIELVKKHRHIITTRKLAISLWESDEEIFSDIGVFIPDECHILGEKFHDLCCFGVNNAPIRLGLTGTLPTKSKNPLKLQQIYNTIGGKVIKEVLPGYLMEKGYAAELDVRVVKIDDVVGKEKMEEAQKNWDWSKEEEHYSTDTGRAALIANFIRENCPRNTMIIGWPKTVKMITEYLGCDFIDGSEPEAYRESCYRKFDEMEDYCLGASYGTSGVGLSIDMIFFGVTVDIGENPAVAGQSIGRFMRKDQGGGKKNSCTVFDFYSDTKYGRRQKTGRMRYYKQRGIKFVDNAHTIVNR